MIQMVAGACALHDFLLGTDQRNRYSLLLFRERLMVLVVMLATPQT
jgi:hypothetical protein